MEFKTPLPIDSILGDLVDKVRAHRCVVVEAPPGAGKTTRVPVALLESGAGADKRILVVEPRRIAARLAAGFVARERGGKPGEEVGYRVRHDTSVGRSTRLIFQTEGLLLRQLAEDPTLAEFGVVVFDEFHERNVASDLALAVLHQMQKCARPDLKIVVMSATLNADFLEAYLEDCARVRSEGRSFPVTMEHDTTVDDRYLERRVRSALSRVLKRDSGDVLVFLPGMGEIRRCIEHCDELVKQQGAVSLPLHGSLPPAEQEKAVRPAAKRKVVFATNVAETSVTIDGVTSVVDSGLARVATMSASGLFTSLGLAPISQASAIQRAGRAGRTQAGYCCRLYTEHDFKHRPDYDAPEIVRCDLSETLLLLSALEGVEASSFPYLSAPGEGQVRAGLELLTRLEALDSEGTITPLGREMLRFPLHPRLAHLVIQCREEGIPSLGILAAAILGERDFRRAELDLPQGSSDILALCDLYREVEATRFSRDRIRNLNLNGRTLESIRKTVQQLKGRVGARDVVDVTGEEAESVFRRCVMRAFPDRVARRVEAGGKRKGLREVLMASGGRAKVAESSVVLEGEYLVALDLGETKRQGRGVLTIRMASRIEPDWILDEWVDWLEETRVYEYNPKRERVEVIEALRLGGICLDESWSVAPADEQAAAALARAAWPLRQQLKLGAPGEQLLARLAFVREQGLETSGSLDFLDSPEALFECLCRGRISLEELRGLPVEETLLSGLGYEERQAIDQIAPRKVHLKGSRSFSIHYQAGKPPWIEGYIQDFYGVEVGPCVAKGRVPLAIHFLAPNRRPIQVTSDLSGFWERHYPDLSKSLSRRYPRHHWPEDPGKAPPILLKRQLKQ